jgi:hypothetical protein
MHGSKRYLSFMVALVCGVAALTGSALAAPPSELPGQAKKEEAPAPAAKPSPPGQEKKAEQAPAPAKGINATTAGVKPSNSTSKGTSCMTGGGQGAAATCQPGPKPDMSKRYGNGKTAAQIANSRGAPADTEIRGPGNSQPHKVCKNGHWVDVHAVKSYSDNTCIAQTSPSAAGTGTSAPTSMATSVSSSPSQQTAASTPAAPAGSAGSAGTAGVGSSAPAGGVLGAEHTSGTGSTGGVAGAFATIGGVAAGSLPFTGFPLWAAVVIGLAAVALGWMLWRRSHPITTDPV